MVQREIKGEEKKTLGKLLQCSMIPAGCHACELLPHMLSSFHFIGVFWLDMKHRKLE